MINTSHYIRAHRDERFQRSLQPSRFGFRLVFGNSAVCDQCGKSRPLIGLDRSMHEPSCSQHESHFITTRFYGTAILLNPGESCIVNRQRLESIVRKANHVPEPDSIDDVHDGEAVRAVTEDYAVCVAQKKETGWICGYCRHKVANLMCLPCNHISVCVDCYNKKRRGRSNVDYRCSRCNEIVNGFWPTVGASC